MELAGKADPHAVGHQLNSGLTILVAAGATFLAFLDVTVVNVAFPALRLAFPTDSVADLSWVVTSYAVLFAALLTPVGRLADVLGRRRLFAVSVLAFTVTSALAAAAPNLPVLVVTRALQGAAAAGMIPAALAVVLAAVPAQRRTMAVGIWAGAGSIAAAVGPSLGGVLIDWTSWRSVFLINVPIGLALVGLTLRYVARDQPSGHRLPDLLGTLAIACGVGLLVLGMTEGSDWGWYSGKVLASLIGGPILLGFSLVKSARHPAPAVDIGLWRSRAFAVANLGSLMIGAALFAWLLFGPVFLTEVWHYSVLKAGVATSPGALTSAVGAALIGRRASVRAQRVVVVAGSLLCAASAFWFYAMLDARPRYLTVFLPAGLLSGFAIGAIITGLAATAVASLPPARFAAGTGLVITARQLGGALGVAALAAILTDTRISGLDALRDVTLLVAVAAIAAAVIGLFLLERATATTAHTAPTIDPVAAEAADA